MALLPDDSGCAERLVGKPEGCSGQGLEDEEAETGRFLGPIAEGFGQSQWLYQGLERKVVGCSIRVQNRYHVEEIGPDRHDRASPMGKTV
jgi:hypothetical protein